MGAEEVLRRRGAVLRLGVQEPPIELGPAVLEHRRDALLAVPAELLEVDLRGDDLLLAAVKKLEDSVNAPEDRTPHFAGNPHPLNYNVGIIRGGDWTSSVPEECTFEVRISAYPGESLEEIGARFKEHLFAAAGDDPWLAENPPEIGFYAFRAEGCAVSRDEPIFASLRRCHRNVTENNLEFFSFTGTTDIRFFNLYRGTPATCYGPVGANLHAPDEWVDLESVKEVTKVLALTAIDWCGKP